MRTARKTIALVLLVAFPACDNPAAPPLPDGAVAFAAPAVYQRWWQMVEKCSGRTGLLAAVHFYEMPGTLFSPINGESLAGFWTAAGNRIVLKGGLRYDGGTVRHEMLHALLGNGSHPHAVFLGACAGVVGCSIECAADGGPTPTPDPSAVTVNSDAIQVSIAIEPAAPSVLHGDGFFELVVTAKNPASHSVIVSFPTSGTPYSFAYGLREPSGLGSFGGVIVYDETEKWFSAGETKKHVFDVSMMPGVGDIIAHSGTYSAWGEYAHMASATIDLVVNP
jgi:hypothetical protein